MFAPAATELGYHPFPVPSTTFAQASEKPEGEQIVLCVSCGYRERSSCAMDAKASAETTLLPTFRKQQNPRMRFDAQVVRADKDATGDS